MGPGPPFAPGTTAGEGTNRPHHRLPAHHQLPARGKHMRTRYLVSGLLAAALLSTPAFAQTSTTNPPAAAPKADVGAPKLASPHWRSSKLIGVNIYNEQNEKLGDINEIILDKEGK